MLEFKNHLSYEQPATQARTSRRPNNLGIYSSEKLRIPGSKIAVEFKAEISQKLQIK